MKIIKDQYFEGERPLYAKRGGLYLENGDRLAQLLRDCAVPLYVSGHVHTRMVLQEQGLTEATCGDLEKHAYSVNDGIKDGQVRNLHILHCV